MVSSLTDEEWRAAQAVRLEFEASFPASQRLAAVQQKIVEQCEAGCLVSAFRPVGGGAMAVVPKELWNTESWHQRFFMCQLNPSGPFRPGVAGDGYCWIFLTRQSLDKFLLGQPFAGVATESTCIFRRTLRSCSQSLGNLPSLPNVSRRRKKLLPSFAQRGPGPRHYHRTFWARWPRCCANLKAKRAAPIRRERRSGANKGITQFLT